MGPQLLATRLDPQRWLWLTIGIGISLAEPGWSMRLAWTVGRAGSAFGPAWDACVAASTCAPTCLSICLVASGIWRAMGATAAPGSKANANGEAALLSVPGSSSLTTPRPWLAVRLDPIRAHAALCIPLVAGQAV